MIYFDKIGDSAAYPIVTDNKDNNTTSDIKKRVHLLFSITKNQEGTPQANDLHDEKLFLSIHCKGDATTERPKLYFDRIRWTTIKVHDSEGKEVWLKVNKESLRKRLGMSREEFKATIRNGEFDSNILNRKLNQMAVEEARASRALYHMKNELEGIKGFTGTRKLLDKALTKFWIAEKYLALMPSSATASPFIKKALQGLHDKLESEETEILKNEQIDSQKIEKFYKNMSNLIQKVEETLWWDVDEYIKNHEDAKKEYAG